MTAEYFYADTEVMAARREERAKRQKALLNEFKTPLVCFTMNIPGPCKFSPLIETVFLYGAEALASEFSENTVHFERVGGLTGCEAFFSVNADARFLKARAVSLEEALPAGRLYDIDVLTADGVKLSRGKTRECIICGGAVFDCARSRAHGLAALQKATEKILIHAVCEYISNAAYRALLKEVHLTPKPGLVDELNSGANSDMDILLFEKSAETLKPYFYKFAEYCLTCSDKNFNDEFINGLRALGAKAESAMFKSTDGVNTHKGAVYSLGLIVSAYAVSISAKPFPPPVRVFGENGNLKEILAFASDLAKRVKESGDAETAGKNAVSNAKPRNREAVSVSGAVEQAKAGFPAAVNALRTYYKAAKANVSLSPWEYALLNIMAELPDKNALRRGGISGAEFVKTRARSLLKKGIELNLNDLQTFDKELTARNLNCGGCADMLAAAMLLNTINGTLRAESLLQNKIQ